MSDALVIADKIGFSTVPAIADGEYTFIVDTENSDTPTYVLGSGGGNIAVPLGLATSEISPAALSGNVDNYAPTGIAGAHVLRINGGAAERDITGILRAGTLSTAKIKHIINVGTTNGLAIKNLVTSIAANQFSIGADRVLTPGDTLTIYDETTLGKWVAL